MAAVNPSLVRVGAPKPGVRAADNACPVIVAEPLAKVERVVVTVTVAIASADNPEILRRPDTGSIVPMLEDQVKSAS
jgi:hypothetical protein